MQIIRQIKSNSLFIAFLLLLTGIFTSASAQHVDPEIFKGIKLRNLVPSRTGGRVVDIAVDPENPNIRFVAAASGNIWRTKNAGTTWEPVFENYGSYSIGVIEIDPTNSKIIWVGSGENNSQRSVSKGDGVYKSEDGGDTWANVGLKTSEHIGKIVIDPRNSEVVCVACQGSVWKAGGERGLYRTINGGKTWDRILHISEDTGISDLIQDPDNPNVLIASTYQRRRHVGVLVAGGPEGGIWKSKNGGSTWYKLTNGMPGGDLGRIGLAMSPQKRNVVYALVAGKADTKGFYRSENQGENWVKMSDFMVVDAQYYMELFPDPHRFDKVYCVGMRLRCTEDGGKTFARVNDHKIHVDHHEVVFNLDDPDYLMIGNDGGVYESWDQGKHWKFVNNLPITQYYRVGIDNSKPFYYVYGGTQDNATQGAPSRTTDRMGIRNSDWFNTVGGDGFQTRVDPDNPNLVYSQSQYGGLVRYDKLSGERIDIQPQPPAGAAPYRWYWDAPLIISPHQGQRLYFAAERIFRSDDRGNSWQTISDDLSHKRDRNLVPVMNRVWGIDAVFKNVWTSPLGEVTALDESPFTEGLIYAGTDDGIVQITGNGGETWRKITNIKGIPPHSFVADIHASRTDANTVFAIFNNHKYGDYRPYIAKSSDRGNTWALISGNLPQNEYLWSVVQDHQDPNLLFVGAEYGLYFSMDGGKQWVKWQGGIPTIAIRDLEIQKNEDDLVAASFGRGMFIFDDYSALRNTTSATWDEPAILFPVKEALLYIQTNPSGNALGNSYQTSANPEFGAVFTYYIRDKSHTLHQKRVIKENEKVAAKKPVHYPEWENLLAERLEDEPQLIFTIKNHEGRIIRRINKPLQKGMRRVNWDLRHFGGEVLVSPGIYYVSMAQVVNGIWAEIAPDQEFRVKSLDLGTLPASDRKELEKFELEVYSQKRAISEVDRYIQGTITDLEKLRNWGKLQVGTSDIYEQIQRVYQRMNEFKISLKGNHLAREKMELIAPSIQSRINRILYGLSSSFSDYTQTQIESFQIAKKEFDALNHIIHKYNETTIEPLNVALGNASAPLRLDHPPRGFPAE